MKVAAVDLGSNSIHMVIAEIASSGELQLVDREAEMVRLGAGALSTGVLADEAMDRSISILMAYKRLARLHRVEEILAVATSAIREARNGEDFLNRIGRRVGIWPRAIPGEEEARLVYLAALHSVHLEGRRALVLDIGGGSVEIAVGRGASMDVADSLKLGVLRMTEEFVKSDPIGTREEKRLVSRVRELVEPLAERVERIGFDRAVGTSGTILTLGRLALAEHTDQRPLPVHHATVSAEAIHQVRKKLTALDLRRRLKAPGVDRRRVDILPAGAIILDTLLSRLGIGELTLGEWALREGMLLDYATRQRSALARAEAYPDVRRRSVLHLAERWSWDETHARHVARLALELFDATRRIHGLGKTDRSLLEFAALLHDVGHHISHRQHHRHSYYLVRHGDLRGFDPAEIELMATVARYHAGGTPSKKHPAHAALRREDRQRVEVLSAILRLAEALDRTHRQRVRSVARVRGAKTPRLRCKTVGDVELEIWGARRHVEFLQGVLSAPVRLEFASNDDRMPARGKQTAGIA